MLVFVKYGAMLAPENFDGSDLDVQVFSDTVGTLVTRTVSDGDTVIDVSIDPGTGVTTGVLWTVKDGEPWSESATNDWLNNEAQALLMVSICDDLDYQRGAISVLFPDGKFVNSNLGVTLALIEAATAGP